MRSYGSHGSCLGNDSRCSGNTGKTCNFLAQEGSDCKWRGAYTVNGSMIMTVSAVEGSVSSDAVQNAVVETVADITKVPKDYVDVDVVVGNEKRRLRASQVPVNGNWRVTYVISVPGDAP